MSIAGMIAMGAAGVSPFDSMFGFKRSKSTYSSYYQPETKRVAEGFVKAKYDIGQLIKYDSDIWNVKDRVWTDKGYEYLLYKKDLIFFGKEVWVYEKLLNKKEI